MYSCYSLHRNVVNSVARRGVDLKPTASLGLLKDDQYYSFCKIAGHYGQHGYRYEQCGYR